MPHPAVPARPSNEFQITARRADHARDDLLSQLGRQDWQRAVASFDDATLHRLRHAARHGDQLEIGRIFASAVNAIVMADARLYAMQQEALYIADGAAV